MTAPGQLEQKERYHWSSERAFVFSMSAAAIGLGNLWRFPYIAGQNGGGAFILAYLIALLVIVLPIMMLEVAIGRLAKGSTVQSFGEVKLPIGKIFGWFVVTLTAVITSYYIVITGWTLGYAVEALTGELEPFAAFTTGYQSFWYFLIVMALLFILLNQGIQAIEKLNEVHLSTPFY